MINQPIQITRNPLPQSDLETLTGFMDELYSSYDTQDFARGITFFQEYAGLIIPQNEPNLHTSLANPNDLQMFLILLDKLAIAVGYKEEQSFADNMKQLSRPQLLFSLSDICDKYQSEDMRCLHCSAGDPKNDSMKFEDLLNINPDFIKVFNSVGFSIEGEPYIYKSPDGGKDLADVILHLHSLGQTEFFISTGIFMKENERYKDVTKKLAVLKAFHPEIKIDTRLTYHSFVLDQKKFDVGFATAFKHQEMYADSIEIKLLDGVGSKLNSEALTARINNLIDILLEDSDVKVITPTEFAVQNNARQYRLSFSQVRSLYNYGEYSQTLAKEDTHGEYRSMIAPQVCDNALIPEKLVVFPNGEVSLCATPHYHSLRKRFNIFEKGADAYMDFLEKRYRREQSQFIERFPQIARGEYKFAACKRIHPVQILK